MRQSQQLQPAHRVAARVDQVAQIPNGFRVMFITFHQELQRGPAPKGLAGGSPRRQQHAQQVGVPNGHGQPAAPVGEQQATSKELEKKRSGAPAVMPARPVSLWLGLDSAPEQRVAIIRRLVPGSIRPQIQQQRGHLQSSCHGQPAPGLPPI